MKGFHRKKKILQVTPETTMFYTQAELHFYSTMLKNFRRQKKHAEKSPSVNNTILMH